MVENGQLEVFNNYTLTVITVLLKIKPGDHSGRFQSLTPVIVKRLFFWCSLDFAALKSVPIDISIRAYPGLFKKPGKLSAGEVGGSTAPFFPALHCGQTDAYLACEILLCPAFFRPQFPYILT
jgi:hypothetical protein